MYGFGLNGDSQLGLNISYGDKEDPTLPSPAEIAPLNGKLITHIAGGSSHTVFLSDKTGVVYTCGRERSTGQNKSENKSILVPTEVPA